MDYVTPTVSGNTVSPDDPEYSSKPNVDGAKTLVNGVVSAWSGECITVTSPIVDASTGSRAVLGTMAKMGEADALKALEGATNAWAKGRGAWPQMSISDRIQKMQELVVALKEKRDAIVKVLMWEICKNSSDAAAEFDRTMKFIDAAIAAMKEEDKKTGDWVTVSGVMARTRRAAVGVTLVLGPFNYPFNETYAMLIPALLNGNTVVMKVPNIGGLAHVLTMEIYASVLPPGVVNFVTGSGRATCPPIMQSGAIDMLAFIGGSRAADSLIKDHPAPHRLKVFSQLEGKNLAIVLPDADLEVAVAQCVTGSTSYNGQRCTAIKLIMLHDSIAAAFLDKFQAKVAELKVGLPWEGAAVTPLPEPAKPKYLQDLIADALAKGAQVVNSGSGGGQLAGGALFSPAIVYPVSFDMRLAQEEQFGPVIPVGTFTDIEQVYGHLSEHWNGQQAAVFTRAGAAAAPVIDFLCTIVGRINLNTQCGRSPDVFPFSGRRSSAMGTMSVTGALQNFSIETVLAFAAKEPNEQVAKEAEAHSKFLQPIA